MSGEIWSSVLLALLILLVAVWLMRSHVRTWQTVQRRRKELEPRELDYRRRQFRRRMQTSAMLGLVGIGILFGGLLIAWRARPWLVLMVWGGVMVLVVWLGLLAVADMVSTRFYYGRLKQDYRIEEARLHAELRRLQRIRGNGEDTKHAGEKQSGSGGRQPKTNDKGLTQE